MLDISITTRLYETYQAPLPVNPRQGTWSHNATPCQTPDPLAHPTGHHRPTLTLADH